ncbi:MAG: T9SS type A sorting domain-containing protein [Bacteroidetes bacterium]|nr:T9SS type A sorting domain-containing protein [Bacteroidota bacterium]
MKKNIYILSFTLVLLLNSLSGQTWKPVEVPIGDARLFRTDPHRPGVIYVGYQGVIAGSSDGGESWFYKPYGDVWDLPIEDLLIDAVDSTHWYIVNEAGLLKSTDGGDSWYMSNRGLEHSFRPFFSIVQNPEHPRILYIVNDGGVQKSTDRGESWMPRLIDNVGQIQALVINSSDPDSLYVFTNYGEVKRWVSGNGGLTWVPDHDALYGSLRNHSIGPGDELVHGRRVSRDYGETWTSYEEMETIYYYAQELYNKSINIPEQELYVLVGPSGVFTRSYEDTIWRATDFYWGDHRDSVSQLWHILHYERETNTIWGRRSAQLWKSTDGCKTFEMVDTGPFLPIVWGLHTPDPAGNIILSKVLGTVDNGKTWDWVGYLPEMDPYVFWPGAISPIDSTFQLLGRPVPCVKVIDPAERFRSRGVTNCPINSTLTYNRKLHFNPHNPHEIFGGYTGLWRTTDSVILHYKSPGGLNPRPDYSIGPKLEENPGSYNCMAFHPHIDGVYYLCWNEWSPQKGDWATLWKTTDFGENWTPLLDWFSWFYSDIVINPDNPDIIVIASHHGILRSGDGGASWTQHDDAPFHSTYMTEVLIDPRMPNVYYAAARTLPRPEPQAGRRGGLYVSHDYAQTWEEVPLDGMHNVSIRNMHYHENPRRLYVGTGAGIYEMLLPEETTGVKSLDAPASPAVHVYPNPARTGSTVQIDLKEVKGRYSTVELFSLQGRRLELLHMGASTGTPLSHSVGDLQPGVYYYRVTTGGKKTTTVPLIIIR